jgi:hypothetical protein
MIIAAVVPEIVAVGNGDARDASIHKAWPTNLPLRALHVFYAGPLVNARFHRRTGDNGT